mgnify:CR=1 FL=1
MVLPIVSFPEKITADDLVREFEITYGKEPEKEQINAWKSSLDFLIHAGITLPVIAELPIFGERADFVFVNDTKGLVVEMKGWRKVEVINDYLVRADGKKEINPCYQLENYVNKLNYFHSSGVKFEGVVVAYNAVEMPSLPCRVITDSEELREEVEKFTPVKEERIREVINGKLSITDSLVELLRKNGKEMLNNASQVLLSRGYGLSEEQVKLVDDVLSALENGEEKTFLVRGESGSGKTLVALTLLFEGLKRKYRTILAYKNNRLLNTLRYVLHEVSGAIMFYSTGFGTGVAEPKFDQDIDLVIFDEAQRMKESNIEIALRRGKVRVLFYDDSQILIGEEAGTRENFLKYAKNAVEYTLNSVYRENKNYLEWVRSLLWGQPQKAKDIGIEIKVFDKIEDLLNTLKGKDDRALICAFTETEGDKEGKDPKKNVRISPELDLYKGVDLLDIIGKDRIEWLMDEKREYPAYWSNKRRDLTRCASVYGAQGFEAEHVGVVWGRDLIWRGKWEINPSVITDSVGGSKYGLKYIAKRSKELGLKLLKNRYYVMLTRGIKGIYLFVEDEKTKDFIKSLLQ